MRIKVQELREPEKASYFDFKEIVPEIPENNEPEFDLST